MTSETRYMRNSQSGGYYELLTSNSSSYSTLSVGGEGELGPSVDIRIRDQNGNVIVNWEEIIVDSTNYTLYDLYINVPSTYVERIIVDVRVRVNGTSNTRSFQTDILNAIVSGLWHFMIWARYYYSPQLEFTTCFFRHGNSTYNSRVENFSYGIAQVGGILVQII